MERKKIPKWAVRLSAALCAVFVFLCAFLCMPTQNAYAMPGNGTVDTTLTTPFPFDNIIWTNALTGNNYYLSWALNDFTATGYNQKTDYFLGNSLFHYSTTPYVTDNVSWVGAQGNMSSRLYMSHDVRDAGSITLSASEFFLDHTACAGDYQIAFGEYGEFPFTYRVSITFGTVSSNDQERYISYDTIGFTGESVFTSDVVSMWSINLCDILIDWVSTFEGQVVYIDQMDVVLRRVGNSSIGETINPATANGHFMWVAADVYSSGDRSLVGMDYWFELQDLQVMEGPTYVTEFPSNWTGWMAEAISGFMEFQFAPGLSVGTIFACVFGVLVLWFILHLFM